MESFGAPASSIHLGRGDCWGMPSRKESLWEPWSEDVNNYFEEGAKMLCGFDVIKITGIANKKLIDYIKEDICKNKNAFKEEIPKIFLEALTFEKPFTKRIIDTFKRIGLEVEP
jgi:hypothetical protein